jgi:hypothetical protein
MKPFSRLAAKLTDHEDRDLQTVPCSWLRAARSALQSTPTSARS